MDPIYCVYICISKYLRPRWHLGVLVQFPLDKVDELCSACDVGHSLAWEAAKIGKVRSKWWFNVRVQSSWKKTCSLKFMMAYEWSNIRYMKHMGMGYRMFLDLLQ